MKRLAYIGHYTDASRIGIRVVRIDDASGAVEEVRTVLVDNAIWMTQSRDGSVLYATCDDGLVAYRATAAGALEGISRVRLGGLTAP